MFIDKDDVRWVCFGAGRIAVGFSKPYMEENGLQLEVQLRDAKVPHPISGQLQDCSADVMSSYPCKVVLGFNKLESIDVMINTLKEARAELAKAIAKPKEYNSVMDELWNSPKEDELPPDDTCMCGDYMKGHSVTDNHTPVSMLDHYLKKNGQNTQD